MKTETKHYIKREAEFKNRISRTWAKKRCVNIRSQMNYLQMEKTSKKEGGRLLQIIA